MKFECVKEDFEKAIGLVVKVSSRHANLPILSCVKIEAKKNKVILSATNLDLAIEVFIAAKILKEGSVAVPAMLISSFFSNLPYEKQITLEVFQNNLRLIGSKNSSVMKAVPHDDFPETPHISNNISFSLPAPELVRGLSSVMNYAAVTAVKPELGSVYIHTDSDAMYFVATDSFRLGEKRIKIKKPFDIKILVPAKNIPDIVRAISSESGLVEVGVSEHQIVFSVGNVYIVSRVVDGTFPDYQQIIPKNKETEIIVLKEDLIHAFKSVSVFSDKFNQVHLAVFPKEKRFELSAKNNDVGESHYTIPATLSGADIEANFNLRYLTDCLSSFTTDSLTLTLNQNNPLLCTGISDQSFRYLVMPMNK